MARFRRVKRRWGWWPSRHVHVGPVHPGRRFEPEDASFIARLVPATPSPYHRLNPLTKALVATVVLGQRIRPRGLHRSAIIIVVMLILAWRAGVLRRLARASFLLTLPIAISVILVSVFTRARDHRCIFEIGPFDATRGRRRLRGPDRRAAVRHLDLDRAVHPDDRPAGVRARPRAARRAAASSPSSAVGDDRERYRRSSSAPRSSVRASGLAGSIRGKLPRTPPRASCRWSGRSSSTSLTDVEERSLALETRAFSRPGDAPSPVGNGRHHLGTRRALAARGGIRGIDRGSPSPGCCVVDDAALRCASRTATPATRRTSSTTSI